ncbi:hypothetical protein TREMEDRAFT_62110 [Tremella mesenterica DSM 1558]|uniref:uncharacterized protein n=1 Tax=Tremella mesenterica (strain ATCC 24925 / CBS 8224 / DSM 1558 / NBRC 9311 / NRRL Y-6157 / RJB 2259-6 / UBC 559-6) TaxID=578456 RepID=UPI0003F49DE3|nr:uncharacterized protein TREMEDRAFT_62110 [Tremella mesenterica DSM 1558]EIW69256.1 hypothetical protein TREMEDRAFT_62110 [Tremella mesenterica DSM 1558]
MTWHFNTFPPALRRIKVGTSTSKTSSATLTTTHMTSNTMGKHGDDGEDDWETADLQPTNPRLRPSAPAFQPRHLASQSGPSRLTSLPTSSASSSSGASQTPQAPVSRPFSSGQNQTPKLVSRQDPSRPGNFGPTFNAASNEQDARVQVRDESNVGEGGRGSTGQEGEAARGDGTPGEGETDGWFVPRPMTVRQLWESPAPIPQPTSPIPPLPSVRQILRRPQTQEPSKSSLRTPGPAKTYEEKEEAYRLARERIFGQGGQGGNGVSPGGSRSVSPQIGGNSPQVREKSLQKGDRNGFTSSITKSVSPDGQGTSTAYPTSPISSFDPNSNNPSTTNSDHIHTYNPSRFDNGNPNPIFSNQIQLNPNNFDPTRPHYDSSASTNSNLIHDPTKQRPQTYNPNPQPYSPNSQLYNPNPQLYNPNSQLYNPSPQLYNPSPFPTSQESPHQRFSTPPLNGVLRQPRGPGGMGFGR